MSLLTSLPAQAQQEWELAETLGQSGTLTAERAEDWEALFWRDSGWTGADGIYSIPLSEVDQPGQRDLTDTLFVFSDTFIGEVGPDGERLGGWSLINNTLARLSAGDPDPLAVDFYWPLDGQGRPKAVFEPQTPQAEPDHWYWLMDGFKLGDEVYVFALRMKPGDGGGFNFAVAGINLLAIPLASDDPLGNVRQLDVPLFVPEAGDRKERFFGAGVLANTVSAGSPHPDGYIYVYGEESKASKRLLASRVKEEDFENFSEWQFWNGREWVPEIEESAEISRDISAEFSVSVLPDGRFVHAYQNLGLGREMALRFAQSPVGPFTEPTFVWLAPEPDFDPDIFVYNAKAHPHLSEPGELLVSYNVNSFAFGDNLRWAGLYRPRFVRIRLAP